MSGILPVGLHDFVRRVQSTGSGIDSLRTASLKMSKTIADKYCSGESISTFVQYAGIINSRNFD